MANKNDDFSHFSSTFEEAFNMFNQFPKRKPEQKTERTEAEQKEYERKEQMKRNLAELERRHPIEKYVLKRGYGVARLPNCFYKGHEYPYLYICELQESTFGKLTGRINGLVRENKFDIVDLQYSTSLGYGTEGSISIGSRLSGVGGGEVVSYEHMRYNAFVVFAPRGYY